MRAATAVHGVGRAVAAGGLIVGTWCAASRPLAAQRQAPHADSSGALAVPYVSQSELLCGGAAIAMLERWWGRRGVYAEDFAALVHRERGGILTSDMERTMRARGWTVRAGALTAAQARQSVADSSPVIALIEVARQRYHYVVIIAWNDARVTYHDPAAAPAMSLDVAQFLRKWSGANAWAMIVTPSMATPAVATPAASAATPAARDSLPCRPWLDRAADAVAMDSLAQADRLLATAASECASEPLVLRERAGLRFRQGNRAEAAALATAYTQRVPSDSLGWQLVASSRYLVNDAAGALRAWNVIGRPRIDLLRIDGTHRVRYRTLSDAVRLEPGTVLTPQRLALAQRRLADIPPFALTRIGYVAVPGGAVEVQAAVVERPLFESRRRFVVATALSAAGRGEAWATVFSPLRLGDVWTGLWRWQSANPRVTLHVDLPARVFVPGVVSVERSWETYRFSSALPTEVRSVSSVAFRSWSRPFLEHLAGVRFERWTGYDDYLTLFAGGTLHVAQDRVSLMATAEHAVPTSSTTAFDRLKLRGAWTLPADRHAITWSMRLGADAVSDGTPRGIWPLAGGGLSRDIPLRAHPWIVENRVPGARVAQRIVHGGVAADRPLFTRYASVFGVGLFLDAANIMASGSVADSSRFYLDGGAGVRVTPQNPRVPSMRLDLARGLATDQRWGITAALVQPLPVRFWRAR